MPPGSKVSAPATRNAPPAVDEFGLVVRPIFGGVPVPVEEAPSTDGVLTAVPASGAPVTLLAANATRLGFSIRNSSTTAWLYVKSSTHGGAVSDTFHTVAISPCGYYEDPYHYVGIVTGIWANGALTGNALITEYLP